MAYYRDGNYYGDDVFYGVSADSPIDLSYYFTDIDNVFVFSWTFNNVMFTSALATFDYELQLDMSPTFDSLAPNHLDYSDLGTSISAPSPATSVAGGTLIINLNGDGIQTITLGVDPTGADIAADIQTKVRALTAINPLKQDAYNNFAATYSSGVYTLTSGTIGAGSTVVVVGGTAASTLKLGLPYSGIEAPGAFFQDGNVYKGFAVPVFIRQAQPFVFYARVRIKYGATYGGWSDTLLVTTLQDVTQREVHNLISNLPDMHVYPYDEAYKTVTRTSSQLSTNIGKVYWAYALEFDNANLEGQLADNDANIFRARDSRFFDIFGYSTGFQKPSTMQFVDYRNIINEFRLACFVGSTVEAVKLVVASFTGIDPTITPFSQILNFITAGEQVETYTIPSVGPYTVALANLPRNTPSISGFEFTDGIPGPEQYTQGTSASAIPITSLIGGTITINLNGDGPRTITLGTDTTEAAIASDIQAKVRSLIAIHPANTAAYTNFTASYSISTGQYILTSGTAGTGSTVVVTGASDALILKLGLAYRGVETAGTNSGSGPLAPGAANLATATGFAVLASSTITNTGSTVVTGELGLYPGTSVTGFPPGTVSGAEHITDSAAHTAQTDANAAYTDLATRPGATVLSGDLSTHSPLSAGVYKYSSSAGLTGNLTLTGSATDVWVFQIGSTLTTASASSVTLVGGAVSRNVFWQVGSSATLGTTTNFQGTIIAQASITVNTGATINGRLIALTGAVTLDDNTVTLSTPSSGSTATAGTSISAVPSTSLTGGTVIISINGGGSHTITLGTDATGDAIASDIQTQIRALFPLNQAYYDFTAAYSNSTGRYTLTSGLGVSGSAVVVSGGTNAPLLELGVANGGIEISGAPILGFFSVNFSTGVLTFNATNAGETVTVTYLDATDIYSVLESPIFEGLIIPSISPYTVPLANLPVNCPTVGVILSGTVQVTQGSAYVVGTGTTFTSSFSVGAKFVTIVAGALSATYTIESITDDTHLTLTSTYMEHNAATAACSNLSVFTFTDNIPGPRQFSVNFSTGVLTFNSVDAGTLIIVIYLPNNLNPAPPVIYNRLAVGASVVITMHNPADFVIDNSAVKFLLDQIIPAHVEYILVVN